MKRKTMYRMPNSSFFYYKTSQEEYQTVCNNYENLFRNFAHIFVTKLLNKKF